MRTKFSGPELQRRAPEQAPSSTTPELDLCLSIGTLSISATAQESNRPRPAATDRHPHQSGHQRPVPPDHIDRRNHPRPAGCRRMSRLPGRYWGYVSGYVLCARRHAVWAEIAGR